MASALEQLKQELTIYDGKSVTVVSEISARRRDDKKFISHLIQLIDAPENNVSTGATWLIKNHLDDGGNLTPAQTAALVERTTNTDNWAAQLHLCQTFGRLEITESYAKKLLPWLTPLLSHKRPFLRAWSLDALCSLAQRHEYFSEKAKAALKAAADDSAASVRARARNIL